MWIQLVALDVGTIFKCDLKVLQIESAHLPKHETRTRKAFSLQMTEKNKVIEGDTSKKCTKKNISTVLFHSYKIS